MWVLECEKSERDRMKMMLSLCRETNDKMIESVSEVDHPAYRVVSERNNSAWRRPRGRPQNSWLRQGDASC